jgi:hypothetical protein
MHHTPAAEADLIDVIHVTKGQDLCNLLLKRNCALEHIVSRS